MDFAVNLNINGVILFELFCHIITILFPKRDLNFIFIEIAGRTIPVDFFDDVVMRNVDACWSQP